MWLVFGLLATIMAVMVVYFDYLYRTLQGNSGKFSGYYFNVFQWLNLFRKMKSNFPRKNSLTREYVQSVEKVDEMTH